MSEISGKVAIVGVDESDEIGIIPNKPAIQLQAEAARNALRDAGLTLRDVDGVFSSALGGGFASVEIAEYLGIQPRYTDSTSVGGSSFVIHVGHAALAIAHGLCDVALITHGESGKSRVGMPGMRSGGLRSQLGEPDGIPRPAGSYALACSRHMYQYGTTKEQLAEIAVATRAWATLNPKALMREPITIDDVLSSRMISWPFNLLDCCLVTDAAGAVVLTSMERARDLPRTPIAVLGFGEGHDHSMISQMPDLTHGPGRISAPPAFSMAGIKHNDIDVVEVYDSFTYTVLLSLEDLGFCAKGEGGAFVSGQRTAPGGDFPLNTSGGGLSYTHPGMFGIFLLIEAVRQLRGECGARQVPDAEVALVNGMGGYLSSSATAILART